MSVTTERRAAPRIHRKLWAAKVLRDGHVIYWWAEMLAIGLFYILYSAVRNADAVRTAEAFHHAKQLMGWQHALGIDHELTINQWALHFKPLVVAANYYYGSLHFVVTIGVGIYLFRKWPNDYPRWRNTHRNRHRNRAHRVPVLAADAAAPARHHAPRDYGFVDTLAKYPTLWTFNSGAMKNISNQYAAMPSVHCCWALWCACALVPRLKHTWAKWLAASYPVMTVSVIVITANHYFLDAVGGFMIFGIGYVVARLFTRAGRGPVVEPEPVPTT